MRIASKFTMIDKFLTQPHIFCNPIKKWGVLIGLAILLVSCGFFTDLVSPDYISKVGVNGRIVWLDSSKGFLNPVGQVVVTLDTLRTVTDSFGLFHFENILSGNHTLTLQKISAGFFEQKITIQAGLSASRTDIFIQRDIGPHLIQSSETNQLFEVDKMGELDFVVYDRDSSFRHCRVQWGDSFSDTVSQIWNHDTVLLTLYHRYSQSKEYPVQVILTDAEGHREERTLRLFVPQQVVPILADLTLQPDTLDSLLPIANVAITAKALKCQGYIRLVTLTYWSMAVNDLGELELVPGRKDSVLDQVTGRIPANGLVFNFSIPTKILPSRTLLQDKRHISYNPIYISVMDSANKYASITTPLFMK